jgi:hypothetical protein
MEWMWTWGGEFFGYRIADQLFTYRGIQVGRLDGDEVYGTDGHYLGEVMAEKRLITHRSKKHWRHSGFAPTRGGWYARYCNYVGFAMYAGYEDFPPPSEF